MSGKDRLDSRCADVVAEGFKTWGEKHGATHYAYRFQPLAGFVSGKFDTFYSWDRNLSFEHSQILNLKGQSLLRNKVNSSSFFSQIQGPSYLLKGHITWDVTTFPFIMQDNSGVKVLVIPALFFSPEEEALDQRIPFLRSEEKIEGAVLRLLRFCGAPWDAVHSSLAITQQFYIVDRAFYLQRKDLVVSGRDLCGDLTEEANLVVDEAINDRVAAFVLGVEETALRLGILVKICPIKGSKLQFEATLRSEMGPKAVDNHMLLLELMEKIGSECGITPLFHVQPFACMNRSYKRLDWTLMTSDGTNLLSFDKRHRLLCLTILTSIIFAVYDHADLLCSVTACPNYDNRFSCLKPFTSFDCDDLFELLDSGFLEEELIEKSSFTENSRAIFTFHGDRFIFRGLASSINPGFSISAFQAAVSDSLSLILDELADAFGNQMGDSFPSLDQALPVLRNRFNEAKSGLLSRTRCVKNDFCPDAINSFMDRKSVRCFEKILNETELQYRYTATLEQYARSMANEAQLMTELFRMKVLPLLLKQYEDCQIEIPAEVSSLIEHVIKTFGELDKLQELCIDLGSEIKAKVFYEMGVPKMVSVQPLPKFWLPKNS